MYHANTSCPELNKANTYHEGTETLRNEDK